MTTEKSVTSRATLIEVFTIMPISIESTVFAHHSVE